MHVMAHIPESEQDFSSPVIVGGSGGSGTRMICAILAKAGVFMARHVNPSNDAMFIDEFLNTRLNAILEQSHSVDYSPEQINDDIRAAFAADLEHLIRGCYSDRPAYAPHWGFKHPRTAYILPFLHQLHPQMTFIHVIRDGRDMAFSKNHNQARLHFEAMMNRRYTPNSPFDSIALWNQMNCEAAKWAERNLGERYLCMRYEDICAHPEQEVQRLLAHIGMENADISRLLHYVTPSSGIGRWRETDARLTEVLEELGAGALTRFGYKAD